MNKKTFELLVVEDDSADVDLIREALSLPSDRPFEIHLSHVEDGEKALTFLKRGHPYENAARPDLIILDLNMPRKGGHDVLREVKGDEQFNCIPIVVLTTSSAYEDVKLSYKLGANSFITKARDFTEFSSIIHSIEGFWFKTTTLPKP